MLLFYDNPYLSFVTTITTFIIICLCNNFFFIMYICNTLCIIVSYCLISSMCVYLFLLFFFLYLFLFIIFFDVFNIRLHSSECYYWMTFDKNFSYIIMTRKRAPSLAIHKNVFLFFIRKRRKTTQHKYVGII